MRCSRCVLLGQSPGGREGLAGEHPPAHGGGGVRPRGERDPADHGAGLVAERSQLSTPEAKRKFKSRAVERTIETLKTRMGNRELAWMFENCFPNTLDTTVDFEMVDGRPLSATQITSAVLERVADYCALRGFECGVRSAPAPQLEEMVRFNIGEEFGHTGWIGGRIAWIIVQMLIPQVTRP